MPRRSRWMWHEGSCSPWWAHAGAGAWQELRPQGSPCKSRFSGKWHTLEQSVPEGCSPCKDPHQSCLWRALTHGKLHIGAVHEVSLKRGTPPLQWGNSVRRKKEQKQNVMNRLQPLFSIPLCHLGGGGGKRFQSETGSLGRREGLGEDGISLGFFSHYPTPLIIHKIISPGWVWFAFDGNW